MSAELLGAAFKAEMGSHVAKLVLLKLVDAADDDGTNIWPAIATIAKAAQAHERTVQKFLRLFQRVDLLQLVAKGGGGPGHTNRYRLNLAMLHRIRQLGWAKATGTESEDAAEEGGSTPPMPSEAVGGIDDAKGGASGHPTPPLDPEGERERAREVEQKPTAVEALELLRTIWPKFALESQGLALTALSAMTASERQQAIDRVPDFLDFHRENRGKKPPPYLATYLTEKRWEDVPERPKATTTTPDAGKVPAFKRTWWWVWDRAARRGLTSEERRIVSGALKYALPWPVDPTKRADFDAAAASALTNHPSDGDHAKAWRSYYRSIGVDMPIPDKVQWVFLPPTGPPNSQQSNSENHQLQQEGVG